MTGQIAAAIARLIDAVTNRIDRDDEARTLGRTPGEIRALGALAASHGYDREELERAIRADLRRGREDDRRSREADA